jgi:hypothetical protein
MQFYRSTLHAGSFISPAVGRIFGSEGQLDFHINGDKQWLVEITREGDRLADHVNRFLSGGLYADLRWKERAILDFRSTRPANLVKRHGDLV